MTDKYKITIECEINSLGNKRYTAFVGGRRVISRRSEFGTVKRYLLSDWEQDKHIPAQEKTYFPTYSIAFDVAYEQVSKLKYSEWRPCV